ncbi:hypothetical protein COOONC_25412 [Cooperia oncophora]
MTAVLFMQLIFINRLRKAVREWYESGVQEEQGLHNFVRQEAKKVESKVKRRRKVKVVKAKDRKLSKDISEGTMSQETTDLYNFFDPGKKLSKESLSKESKGKETMETRSTDSQEELAKVKGSREALKKVGFKADQ